MIRHTITGLVINYDEAITEHCQFSLPVFSDYTPANMRCQQQEDAFQIRVTTYGGKGLNIVDKFSQEWYDKGNLNERSELNNDEPCYLCDSQI